jgi:hypothetical protein
MLTKILQKTSDKPWALITQTPPMHLKTYPSHTGNSKSQEIPADNRSIHHRGHHQDVQREAMEVEVGMAEEKAVEEEAGEVDYPHHTTDWARSHHTEMHPTLTSSLAASQNPSQEIG